MKRFLPLTLLLIAACSFAHATTYSMNETWNSTKVGCTTNITSSVCVNHWATTASTNPESLTSASGACTGTWNFANQLKLTHGTGAATVTTYGTVPYIPAGDTYDIYFEYCYSSTTVTGFRPIATFGNPSGGFSLATFYLTQSSSGSGQICINAGPCGTAVSVGVRHLIHISLTPGTNASCFFVDAGACVAFTEQAKDFDEVVLEGDTGASAADLYFGQVYVIDSNYPCAGTGTGTWPPVSLVDFNSLTSGTTVTNTTLLSSVRFSNAGTSFAAPSYTAGSGSDLMEGSNLHAQSFASSLGVCGTGFTNNTGLSLQHHVPVGAPGAFAQYTLIGVEDLKVIGFYWTPVSSNAAATGFVDQGRMLGGTAWHVCTDTSSTGTACTGTGSNFKICSESTSGSPLYQCALITNGSTYWISMSCKASSGATDGFNVYNVNSNGTVGATVLAVTVNNTSGCSSAGAGILLGAAGSENPGVTYDEYVSGLIECTASCTFPLLPPAAPAGLLRAPPMIRASLNEPENKAVP